MRDASVTKAIWHEVTRSRQVPPSEESVTLASASAEAAVRRNHDPVSAAVRGLSPLISGGGRRLKAATGLMSVVYIDNRPLASGSCVHVWSAGRRRCWRGRCAEFGFQAEGRSTDVDPDPTRAERSRRTCRRAWPGVVLAGRDACYRSHSRPRAKSIAGFAPSRRR